MLKSEMDMRSEKEKGIIELSNTKDLKRYNCENKEYDSFFFVYGVG